MSEKKEEEKLLDFFPIFICMWIDFFLSTFSTYNDAYCLKVAMRDARVHKKVIGNERNLSIESGWVLQLSSFSELYGTMAHSLHWEEAIYMYERVYGFDTGRKRSNKFTQEKWIFLRVGKA